MSHKSCIFSGWYMCKAQVCYEKVVVDMLYVQSIIGLDFYFEALFLYG